MDIRRFHDKLNQPAALISFLKRTFGKKQIVKRASSGHGLKLGIVHYDEVNDTAFYYYCGKAEQEGKLKATNKDVAFITKGFTNWRMLQTAFVVMSRANVT